MTRSRSLSRAAATAGLVGALLVPGAVVAQEARQGMVSLDDARIFYEVVGSGDPIIVVHGGPGLEHGYLQPGLDALATRYALVYYDQRGTGRSSAELTPSSINPESFSQDIDALRQVLGYEQVTVLGHSFGALIAMEYAARYPDETRGLILMNPVEPGTRWEAETAERRQARRTTEDAQELRDLRASEGFAARDPGTLSEVYRVSFRSLLRDRELIDELDLDLQPATARNGQDVAALLGAELVTEDGWDRPPSIEAPTLVLHGRYDAPPLEMSRALAEAFPTGTLEVLNTGHFPYVEDREALLAAVSGFFAGLR